MGSNQLLYICMGTVKYIIHALKTRQPVFVNSPSPKWGRFDPLRLAGVDSSILPSTMIFRV